MRVARQRCGALPMFRCSRAVTQSLPSKPPPRGLIYQALLRQATNLSSSIFKSNPPLSFSGAGSDFYLPPPHTPAPESRNQSRCLVVAALFILTKGKGSVSSLLSILAHGLEYDQTALNVNERTLHMYRKRLSAINIDNKKS